MFKTKKATSKRLLKRGFSAEEINSINVSEFKTIDEAVEHLLASKNKTVDQTFVDLVENSSNDLLENSSNGDTNKLESMYPTDETTKNLATTEENILAESNNLESLILQMKLTRI